MTIPKSVELKACPFCGARPHHGKGKVQHDQLHGEPFQRYWVRCPSGHASFDLMNAEMAFSAWNTRPQSKPVPQAEMVVSTPLPQWRCINCKNVVSGHLKPYRCASCNWCTGFAEVSLTPEASRQGEVIFTPEAIEAASMEVSRLQNSLDITNADHIALWLEANMVESPLAWLACRIVEAHEAAIAKVLANPPRHVFWGAGEPDCPRDLKAGNGELHTLRCKVCGEENLRNDICLAALQHPHKPDTRDDEIARLRGALSRVRKVRDGYASQMKFCDIEALGYFREFVRRLDDNALSTPEQGS